jgi:putative heme iron utilization protein
VREAGQKNPKLEACQDGIIRYEGLMEDLDSVLDFLLRHLEPTQASFRNGFEACLKDSLEVCVSHD